MKLSYRHKFKTLFLVLMVSAALVAVHVKKAAAGDSIGMGPVVPLVIIGGGLVLGFVTVMGLACTPVAAAKASDYPGGFSNAFRNCFSFDLKEPARPEEPANSSENALTTRGNE